MNRVTEELTPGYRVALCRAKGEDRVQTAERK